MLGIFAMGIIIYIKYKDGFLKIDIGQAKNAVKVEGPNGVTVEFNPSEVDRSEANQSNAVTSRVDSRNVEKARKPNSTEANGTKNAERSRQTEPPPQHVDIKNKKLANGADTPTVDRERYSVGGGRWIREGNELVQTDPEQAGSNDVRGDDNMEKLRFYSRRQRRERYRFLRCC